MKKLGFSADDLKSKERFFQKYGEICVAKIPPKISLQEITSHSWSKPSVYEQSKAALESLGFQRTRMSLDCLTSVNSGKYYLGTLLQPERRHEINVQPAPGALDRETDLQAAFLHQSAMCR